MLHTPLPYPRNYADAQHVALRRAMDHLDDHCEYDRGVLCCRSRSKLFAIFGRVAYELQCCRIEDGDEVLEILPGLVEGQATLEAPAVDEAPLRILHLIRWTAHPDQRRIDKGWFPTWLQCRWVWRRELQKPAHAIADQIAQEVWRGETPLTGGGLPGWA